MGIGRRRCAARAVAAVCAGLLACSAQPARAEVSAQDGFAPGGGYQVHVEFDPYLWLPASAGTVKLGNGATANINAGIPSISQLTNVLTGAFMGTIVTRYGPWSGLIDIQYVSAAKSQSLRPDLLGQPRSLHFSTSLTRVAPGIGYQVYNGALGTVPTTLDAQAGFVWFGSSTTLDLDRYGPAGRERVSSLSGSTDQTQPWVGLHGAIYPAPRWRLAADIVVQGFGVGGGTWGWETQETATWAATKWLNLIAGFRAISSGINTGYDRAIRSLRLTEYGPELGIGITF